MASRPRFSEMREAVSAWVAGRRESREETVSTAPDGYRSGRSGIGGTSPAERKRSGRISDRLTSSTERSSSVYGSEDLSGLQTDNSCLNSTLDSERVKPYSNAGRAARASLRAASSAAPEAVSSAENF